MSRSPITLIAAALLSFVAILITEAVFDEDINWITVICVPFATVIGILIGDAIRDRREAVGDDAVVK